MPPHTTQPPFAPGAQTQPAEQAEPAPPPGKTTRAMAERHEALFLALTALHKDVLALGSKRPGAPVPQGLRIAAEGLLSDCAPFARGKGERLPVAAEDMAGLAVQLGRALAQLETWESQRSYVDARYNCRMWRATSGQQPIMRLKPPLAALPKEHLYIAELREKLVRRIENKATADLERGFRAGRAARQGKPLAEIEEEFKETYPRLRLLY